MKKTYRYRFTKLEFIDHLNTLGEDYPDSAFIMQKKIHKREIGYGVLLQRYKRDEFEKLYNEWVKSEAIPK